MTTWHDNPEEAGAQSPTTADNSCSALAAMTACGLVLLLMLSACSPLICVDVFPVWADVEWRVVEAALRLEALKVTPA